MQKGPLLLTTLFLFISLIACRRDFEKPSWDSDILTPMVKTSLGIEHLVKDTLLERNGDSISIVVREKVYSLGIDSLVKINIEPFEKNVKLASLVLSEQTITRKVTLGEIARGLQAQGNLMGSIILNNHGNPFLVPDIAGIKAGPFEVDANQFFHTAKLLEGEMVISIENQFPLTIQMLDFSLKNKTDKSVVAEHTFTNIAPNSTASFTQDLAGKTVEGNMMVDTVTMDLSSGMAVIDTNDAIIVTIQIKNIKVESATAIFPEQNVVEENTENPILVENGIELVEAIIAKGFIKIEVYSTAQDTIFFNYKIPSAKKGGVEFVTNTKVPPAPPGATSHSVFLYDMKDYHLDLTGQYHDTVNTFYNELIGKIEHTGKVVPLSLSDSLQILIDLIDVTPAYVKGYLGQDAYTASGFTEFDLFDKIREGNLNFEKVNVDLVIENSYGIDGRIKINQLSSRRSQTNESKSLTGPIIGQYNTIYPATDHPLLAAATPINISSSSNAVDLLNILPNQIDYNVTIESNPSGVKRHTQFAYNTAGLDASIDIKLPLSLIAEGVVLTDTIEFEDGSTKNNSINKGFLHVLAENGFPLQATLEMRFLDAGNAVIDSLISLEAIAPAEVNNEYRVTEKKFSKIAFPVTDQRMANILRARKVITKVKLTTFPGSKHVNIYSDYSIDLKLVGDFNLSTTNLK